VKLSTGGEILPTLTFTGNFYKLFTGFNISFLWKIGVFCLMAY